MAEMSEASVDHGAVEARSRSSHGGRQADGRSAVTNGSRLHVEAVCNSAWSRRFGNIFENLCEQFDCTAESDLALARRAAGLAVMLEQGEARIARGEQIKAGAQVTAINAHRRVLADLAASLKTRKRGRAA